MLGNLFGSRKYEVNTQPPAPIPQMPPQNMMPGSMVPGSTPMNPQVRQGLSVMSHLDTRLTQVLNLAKEESKKMRQPLIEPEQLMVGLLFDPEIFKLMSQFSADPSKIVKEIQGRERAGDFVGEPVLSEASKKIFDDAYAMIKGRGVEFISPEDILLSLFSAANSSAILAQQGIKKEDLEKTLSKTTSYTQGKKSTLETFGVDLTAQAKNGELDPIAGRDTEIERTIHILLRRTKNNPIIIGEAGVGKTAVVEGLAQKIVEGSAPKDLQNKRIIQLDLSSLVAGASHRGEFEERLRNVIKETQASSGTVILFIDEIHSLIGAGDTEGALDASNIIKPFLARGQLQIIGTTTTTEYRKYFEKDKAFERRFQPVLIPEPDEKVAVEMLKVLKPKYESFHKVVLPDAALEASVKLSKRYIGERFLPDKAVDLLDEASAEVRLGIAAGKKQDNNVKEEDIQKVVSAWTGIPITKLTENESEKLLHLEDTIHKRLIDQEAAVKAISEAVRRGRIGLSSTTRPIASFIFLGPTGVGKTELAKTLAEILFGKEESMIRLDMSEYMEKHEVAKLIGAPPGYVGYDEGGQLTEAVRRKPYSIVLLDEVEKAHPDVFNILLQLLEDGRLTDNKGNTISFKNTIIVATSNIGSAMIQQELETVKKDGKVPTPEESARKFADLSKLVVGELRKFFRPELLNRFDEIVIFEPLSRKDMTKVAELGINSTKKLLVAQGFDLQLSQIALDRLAKEGYDPVYGARPLRRLIQTAIENPIAILIINKTFIKGDKILIDFNAQKEEFVFSKTAPSPAQAPVEGQATLPNQPSPQTNQAPPPPSQEPQQTIASNQIPQPPAPPTPPTSVAPSVNDYPIPPVNPPLPPQGSNGTAVNPPNSDGTQMQPS
ncbi:MAG: ATP-dependent Clp protease ATP-binding subunit [Patescibacteria group bacterium]